MKKGVKKFKRIGTASLSLFLSIGLIASSFPVVAKANQDNPISTQVEDLISIIDESGMKVYGESIENGAEPQVKDSDVPSGNGITYYVDSEEGNDKNDGTSPNEAWKSINKVNEKTYNPGDRILLKAGSEWSESTLSPKGSGEEDNPIIISSYGEGNAPKLIGKGEVGELIYLYNQEHWDISNLEISNTVEGFTGDWSDENGQKLKDLRGIRIAAKNSGETVTEDEKTFRRLNGFHLHNLYIHDVSGDLRWISGSGTSPGAGVTYGNRWDLSKRTGGILFEILQPDTTEEGVVLDQPTVFNNILIEKNVINNNSFGGIILKQWNGDKVGDGTLWASRDVNSKLNDSHWYPHTNVTIQDNYLSQADTSYGCNTIYVTSVKHGLIQRNISKKAGTCGIEMYYTDDIIVQYNEVFDTVAKAGGADSNAIDPDKEATNALIQYNYIHDTGDGILLCGFVEGSSVVRYNVIKDASKRYLNPHGNSGVNYIYNNIFYNTRNSSGNIDFIYSSAGDGGLYTKNQHYFYNNIFYNASSKSGTPRFQQGSGLNYENNCYYGKNMTPPEADIKPIFADPQFLGSLSDSSYKNLTNLKLKSTSPLINAGKPILDEYNLIFTPENGLGTHDFFGTSLNYNGQSTDIGVARFVSENDKGIINGYVNDDQGDPVEGAKVLLEGQPTLIATTDNRGFYVFTDVTAGTYNLKAICENYIDGEFKLVEILSGKANRVDLTLGESTSKVGTITGKIKSGGVGLQGATVTLFKEGTEIKTIRTNSTGEFTFTDVTVGKGYFITAKKEDYFENKAENIEVKPAKATTVDIILTKDITSAEYKLNVDFDDYETGTFSGNDEWEVINPGAEKGSVEIIEEENGNKYLKMNKTASGNIGFYNKNNQNLSGIVTVEARVKRSAVETNIPNQFGMYSYNSSDWNSATPPSSVNPIGTFAFSKGNIITHNAKGSSKTVTIQEYSEDTWYIIRNVINIDAGTFDLYVDDMTTPKLTNQPLRTQGKNLDKFLFFENGTNVGDISIDYFRVNLGIPYDYNDADLFDLQAEGFELKKDGDNYSATNSASWDTESVTITPKARSGFASVMVNDQPLINGSVTVPLSVSGDTGAYENIIPIVVTAEDGVTTKTYQLIISRENPNDQAYLDNLEVSEGALSPEFDPAVIEDAIYTLDVPANTEKIHLNYDKKPEIADIKIYKDGKLQGETTDGVDPTEVNVTTGKNIIIVEVWSNNGANNVHYTLEVNVPELTIDKSELQEVYDDNKDKIKGNYTDDSWKTFTGALKNAEEILAKVDATQEEVDEAKVVLEAAINGLVEKATEVNKSELQEVYDDNKEKIKGNYTDDSWKAFTGALKNAEEILAKVDATQEEVDTAKGALEDAIKNLKEKSDEINTDKLEEKISKVEGLNKSDYTEESWSVLKKALSAAKELLNNSNITQEAIDKAYEDLAKAEDGLKKKDSNIIPDSDTETGNKDNDELSQGDLPQTGGVNSSIWLALSGLLIVLGVIFLKKNNRIKA